MIPSAIISLRREVPMRGLATLNEQKVGSISSARSSVFCRCAWVSPGSPSTKVASVDSFNWCDQRKALRICSRVMPLS